MLKVILYTIFISLTGIIAFFIYLNHLLHRAFFVAHVNYQKKPEEYGLLYKNVFATSQNGKKIQIWDLSPGKSGPIILGLHGWEIAADSLLPMAAKLHVNWRILLINARNHGDSDDEKYSTVINYKEDIDSAIEFINEYISSNEPVILIGHSLGGAAALYACSQNRRIKGVVSISTFADMEDVMKKSIENSNMQPWFLSSMLAYIEFRLGEKMDKISPRFLINHIECPVLLIHGNKDEVIDYSNLDRIMLSADSNHVHKLTMKDHTHSSLLEDEILHTHINQFLNRYFENL